MTKRPCMKAEEVLDVLYDNDELHDPDEPMMEGSDMRFQTWRWTVTMSTIQETYTAPLKSPYSQYTVFHMAALPL